jgi:hypothetical protein
VRDMRGRRAAPYPQSQGRACEWEITNTIDEHSLKRQSGPALESRGAHRLNMRVHRESVSRLISRRTKFLSRGAGRRCCSATTRLPEPQTAPPKVSIALNGGASIATEAVWVLPYWHVDDVGCPHGLLATGGECASSSAGWERKAAGSAALSRRGQPVELSMRFSSDTGTLPMPSIACPRSVDACSRIREG